jgi:CheY-like chemotaxis protein
VLKQLAASYPNINLVTLTDFFDSSGTRYCYLKPGGQDCQQLGEKNTSDPALLARIRADLGQINQVLINLVVNARDAMPEGGCLTLETSIESANPGVPEVCLGVSDTGHGMDRVTRERMFEPFYTTKPVGAGTGLGLATVYGIVQQSGGRIEVISEPGAGSTFLIRLPLVDGALEEAAQLPAVPGLGSGAATVLVVEDQAILRGLVCETLMSAGFQVLEAECGTEALAVSDAYAGPIELVLTDVVMPGMTGRAMAEQLVAARNGTRVLYMSGYGTNVIAKHGVLDEGVNFLQKPFSPGELVAKVQRILG